MPLVKEIETLARLRADGILTDCEYEAARQSILDEVPEADTVTRSVWLNEALDVLARCVLPPMGASGLVFLLGIPAMLSLTVGVTMMAALLIAQFRETDR